MKNWKIVYTVITGTIMSIEFETFEEMENWLTSRFEQMRTYCERIVIWDLFKDGWKVRHIWKRA